MRTKKVSACARLHFASDLKRSSTTLPENAGRPHGALATGIGRRLPSSLPSCTHPTGRGLGHFSGSTGAGVSRGRPAGRKAENRRAASSKWWSPPQIADHLPPASRVDTASLREQQGFQQPQSRNRLLHLLLSNDAQRPASAAGQTTASIARLAPAGGTQVEPAWEAHSRPAQPVSGRPSLVSISSRRRRAAPAASQPHPSRVAHLASISHPPSIGGHPSG